MFNFNCFSGNRHFLAEPQFQAISESLTRGVKIENVMSAEDQKGIIVELNII